MRRSFMVALTTAMCVSASWAQTRTDKAEVQWGPDMDFKTDGQFSYVMDDIGDAVFLRMSRKKEALVQRMDGLKVSYQKPMELEMDKDDLTSEGTVFTKDNVIVFSSMFDKKAGINQLYASTYDQAGFGQLKRFEKVASISAEKSKNNGGFSVYSSPDRSKVLVGLYPPNDKDKDAKTSFELRVYDADMQQLWAQQFTLPYEDGLFSIESLRLDNDGSVLMLGTKSAEKREGRALKREGKPSYVYHLLTFKQDSPVPDDHAIVVADKFLQDLQLGLGKTGDIICAGFFGNKGSFSVRGTFFLRLDRTTKQIVHESYKEFSNDFITEYLTEKEAKKATKKADKKKEDLELYSFDMHDLIQREDGGVVLVAEQFRYYTVCYTDSKGNQSCSTHYLYNDVIVVNIDPEGNIEWASKVPKRQHSVNDGGLYSGCAVEVKGDKIYVIFNDSGENLFLKPGDKIKQFELTGKDALVVLALVNSDGSTKREALFSPERRDVILRPKDCVQLQNEKMFIYASRKKDYRFGLIDFK
ncbi:MAG: hypothetical protein IPN44_11085 [Flavobacteriales bacterium]|nr:hypothetical protein [Flavobacteriales bacterium]